MERWPTVVRAAAVPTLSVVRNRSRRRFPRGNPCRRHGVVGLALGLGFR